MISILLDTHIVVWWRSSPERLSSDQAHALKSLERRNDSAAISAVTLRELATLGQRGRLEVDIPWDAWLLDFENDARFAVLPLTPSIAIESVRLGADFPRDPADQIIVATARCHGLRLLTADEGIRRWGKVPLI